ncbi:MAG: TPR end-of-group domain-containing protein [bacterium]
MTERKAWSENPSVYWAEAFHLMNEGEFEAAIVKLKDAVEIYPEYYDAWLLLGGAQEAAGAIDEGIVSTEEAVAIARRELALALTNLAYFHLTLADLSKAEAAYEEALRIEGPQAGVFYNLACIFAKRGNQASALEHLKKAIALDPEYREVAGDDEDLENIREEVEQLP